MYGKLVCNAGTSGTVYTNCNSDCSQCSNTVTCGVNQCCNINLMGTTFGAILNSCSVTSDSKGLQSMGALVIAGTAAALAL